MRQTAGDSGKKAQLMIEGAQGELDRNVLERMLPPLEHMLRNAVVHGIETPDERGAVGKPEAGPHRGAAASRRLRSRDRWPMTVAAGI